MRAIIYCRISRDEEGRAQGVARQEQDCRDLCEQRGFEVTQVCIDNDYSAYSGRRRPAYDAMIKAITAGSVDVLVTYAPERLHRNIRDSEDFIDLIEKYQFEVVTVRTGTWDVSTSYGREVARINAAHSRAESERLGERVKRAHQQSISEGYWRGAIPFGMTKTSVPGVLAPHPVEAPFAIDILQRAARGDSFSSIAANLNRQQVRPRRGEAWSHTAIQRLVGSAALGGFVRHRGQLIDAHFDGVVPTRLWYAAQAMTKLRPPRERRVSPERLTLLGGILKCSQHSVPLFSSKKGNRELYQATAPGRCGTSIPRRPIDSLITDVILSRLRRPDANALFGPDSGESEVSASRQEELLNRRQEVAGLIQDGLLGGQEARALLEDIKSQLETLAFSDRDLGLDQTDLQDPGRSWEIWTTPQRRQVVRILLESITVDHGKSLGGGKVDLGRIDLKWVGEQTPDCSETARRS